MVSRSVYRGVLDLLKYLSQHIELTLQSNIDTPLFSVFLIFRLALCLCTNTSSHKKVTKSLKTDPKTFESGRASPVPSLSASIFKEPYNYSSDESHPLLPVEIELQEIFNVADSGDVVSPSCKRVRSHKPVHVIHDGVEVENTEGEDMLYLHDDLLRAFGNTMKSIILKKQFWNSLFSAVVQADRKYLGWNEKTAEMYERLMGFDREGTFYQFFICRYNSLPSSKRRSFGYEEDALLSIVLHNILIFLLMVGISPSDTMDVCHRISARTRLATAEEKLLQVTMSELEKAVSHFVLICKNLIVSLPG